MILLDTNVVSEPWRAKPHVGVITWIDSQPANSLYLCAPVLAELRFGVELLVDGRRKERVRALIDRLQSDIYRDRILPLDESAAVEFGRLAAQRQRAGRRIEIMDALIAAIARSRNATLATRDVSDFIDLGIDVVNPFDAKR